MRAPRPRPTLAYGLARRLALGTPLAAAARAARRDPAWLEALLGAPHFQELLAGWRDLLALEPAARTRRLEALAHLVLEQALAEGRLGAALFTLSATRAGRDPVVTLAGGIERALARAPAGPGGQRPASAPPTGERPVAPRDPLQASAGAAAARLRAQIVREHGQSVADQPGPPRREPREDPLGAAIHARHRAAAAPPPTLVDRLTDRLVEALGPADRLALERLDDRALERLARTLLTHRPESSPARPQGP